jgi:hypothetical protein
MANTAATATDWIARLASCHEIPFASLLQSHFRAGRITRLCDCGCNSFDLAIPPDAQVAPLCFPSSRTGAFFEVILSIDGDREIDCIFFADHRGYLAGLDIMRGQANQAPMPDSFSIKRVARANFMSANAL